MECVRVGRGEGLPLQSLPDPFCGAYGTPPPSVFLLQHSLPGPAGGQPLQAKQGHWLMRARENITLLHSRRPPGFGGPGRC